MRRPPASRRLARRAPLAALLALALLAGCRDKVARADAYENLADQLMANRAWPAAIDALTKATGYEGNEPRRWLKIGRAWRELDNPALSAIAYQHALDLDSANVEALQNLAVLMIRAGRYQDAKQYVGPLLLLSPNDGNGLLASGAIAFYEKRYTDADQIARQIMQLYPAVSTGPVLHARVLEATGHQAEAARLLETRLAAAPDDLDVATQLLELYKRAGDLGGIRRTALVLARLKPDDVGYQVEAARALHAAGREADARATLDRLLARYPGSPGLNRAVADYWRATLPGPEAAARIVAMGGRVHGRARAALAGLLIDAGHGADALALMAPEATGPVTAANVDAQAIAARAALAAGQVDEAARRTDAVLAYDQNDVALLVKAELGLRRGDYTGGLTAAQQVIGDDPGNEAAYVLAAKLYEAQGNLVLARKTFGDGSRAVPDSATMLRAYAEWLAAHGAADDAVVVAGQFARANPRMPAGRDYLRALCDRLATAACRSARTTDAIAGRDTSGDL